MAPPSGAAGGPLLINNPAAVAAAAAAAAAGHPNPAASPAAQGAPGFNGSSLGFAAGNSGSLGSPAIGTLPGIINYFMLCLKLDIKFLKLKKMEIFHKILH